MKIALTGASGFVGQAVQKRFENCVIIKRDDSEKAIVEKLENVDVVINLAGATIVKRWTPTYKKVLMNSRIETTKKLVSAINKSAVKQFISTSAIGVYPNNQASNEETQELASDFLGELAKQWEHEALQCQKPTAILRFGVILGKESGALKQMLTPFKLALGGNLGNGEMMMSWIHIQDLMGIYEHLIKHNLTGIYNATTPKPVKNHTFTKALGKVLKRPTFLPLPAFALNLIYGEASSVLLDSKEVYPKAILNKGYVFEYPEIEGALRDILAKATPRT